MLEIRNLHAGYGKLTVIRDLCLSVARGSTVGIFGRNGAGKSTLMNAIMRLGSISSGDVTWEGKSLLRMRTDQIVKSGVSLVPQTRGVFASQTVSENLAITRFALGIGRHEMQVRLDEVFQRFPPLAERRNALASSMSGGEQQMLAIAKALIRHPRLLLLDEPSIGLAPRMVEEVARVVQELKHEDLTVVVTEQNIPWILALVDTTCILDQGTILETIDMRQAQGVDAHYVVSQYLGGVPRETQAAASTA